MLRILQVIYVVYAMIMFIIPMVFVFIWALLVAPLGRIRGGNLIYRGCMVWGDIWFFLVGIRHRNYFEAPFEKGSTGIYVANHISYMDITTIVKAFRHPVRPLGKAEAAKIPVFGFIYKRVIVSVDRSSPEHRARSVQVLLSILRKGVSVLVFPEGTFNETGAPLKSFYDGAFRIAIETGAPVRPVLFLDTYDRMHYKSLFCMNPGRNRAVFLPEIPTEGLQSSDLPALKKQVTDLMEERLKHYGASWIKA
jgi:1-acyl-sn-glycerol-3-phosphate acyltransferase